MKTMMCLLILTLSVAHDALTGTVVSAVQPAPLAAARTTVEFDSVWGTAQTDQEKCQAEADYMASNRAFYHVGPCIGRFEGIGWSRGGSLPGTCTPRSRMQLTGDATSVCDDGTVVRVRSWR